MKFLLSAFILFFTTICMSQESHSKHELLPVNEISFNNFDDYTIKREIPSKIENPEDIIRQFLFGRDTSLYKELFTDIADQFVKFAYQFTWPKIDIYINKNYTFKINYILDFKINDDHFNVYRVSCTVDGQYKYNIQPTLIKVGNQWKILGPKIKKEKLADYPLIHSLINIKKVRPEFIPYLFTGQQSQDSRLNSVIKATRFKDGFDIDRLYLFEWKWERTNNQKMLDYIFIN